MKPPLFRYLDPEILEEALELLGEHGDEAKVLAGGQSLMPMLSMRLAYPSSVIDLNRIDGLEYIRRANHSLEIGALARHPSLEDSTLVTEVCPLIGRAMPYVGHRAIRNRGTIGGSLAHADPAAELPAVLTALGATATVNKRSGSRTVPVDQLFEMPLVNRLEPDELLTAIHVPGQPADAGSALLEVARRHGDFALAGVAGSVCLDSAGRLNQVRLASFGTGPTPTRLTRAEEAVTGAEPTDAALREAGAIASGEVDPPGDVHASAGYRRAVTGVLVRRALRAAADNALARLGQAE
jgi:carbon-monoxide dehydrogenase medium subunit